ncbi:hypothetical protein CGC58_11460 [Capnocytophaga stomatis]|uniref:Uncharacterized protein n=1 Tax=Capnocytophaga stomatis TaxID=1848904 RepID=A0A250FYS9_9FLAO|nr:hypothetical protein [Capnocytophaga stomatis]ATA90292.1 hypothetical protein CGC58_11460 [Capnocytophaga stomatis]
MKRNKKLLIVLIVLICNPISLIAIGYGIYKIRKNVKNKQEQEYLQQKQEDMQELDKKYKFLHENPGSKNYEVVELIPRTQKLKSFEIDTIGKKLLIVGNPYEEWREGDDDAYSFIKTDFEGNILNHPYGGGEMLKDGTILSSGNGIYCNSIVDDDMTLYPLIQLPFSFNTDYWTEEYKAYMHQDLDEWFKVFKDLYDKAEYVHMEFGEYFLKYRGKWYWMMYPSKEVGYDDDAAYQRREAFEAQYPAREPTSRFTEDVPVIDPFYYTERDTIRYAVEIQHTLTEIEKKGTTYRPISYAAGYFYYTIQMSPTDTIYVKRYSAYTPGTRIIQIPYNMGGQGSNVLFIDQIPNELYPDKSYGGLYVIRPRKKK